jgi:hypothetical protein
MDHCGTGESKLRQRLKSIKPDTGVANSAYPVHGQVNALIEKFRENICRAKDGQSHHGLANRKRIIHKANQAVTTQRFDEISEGFSVAASPVNNHGGGGSAEFRMNREIPAVYHTMFIPEN